MASAGFPCASSYLMPPKPKVDPKQAEQESLQKILFDLLREEDNKYCADCDAKTPRWASWNHGVFLCIRCAGIHRRLGVHISKVKSVNLDSWTPEQVALMKVMGNAKARTVYEAHLDDTQRAKKHVFDDHAIEMFIRNKYEHKRFIATQWQLPEFNVREVLEGHNAGKALSVSSVSSAPKPGSSLRAPPQRSPAHSSGKPSPPQQPVPSTPSLLGDLVDFAAPTAATASSAAVSTGLEDIFSSSATAAPTQGSEFVTEWPSSNGAAEAVAAPTTSPSAAAASDPSFDLSGLSLGGPTATGIDGKMGTADIMSLFGQGATSAAQQPAAAAAAYSRQPAQFGGAGGGLGDLSDLNFGASSQQPTAFQGFGGGGGGGGIASTGYGASPGYLQQLPTTAPAKQGTGFSAPPPKAKTSLDSFDLFGKSGYATGGGFKPAQQQPAPQKAAAQSGAVDFDFLGLGATNSATSQPASSTQQPAANSGLDSLLF